MLMLISLRQCLLFAVLIATISASSSLTTCTDGNCAKTYRSVDMLNRDQNSSCTPLYVTTGGSFQILELDPGCIVTLYEADVSKKGPCSSWTRAVGRVGSCYPSTWKYFSITGCSTRVPGNPSSGPSSTNDTSAPAPDFIGKDVGSPAKRKGLIAGSLVAAVSVTASLITGIWFSLRRRRKSKTSETREMPNDHALVEASNDHALVEASGKEKLPPEELWSDHAAVEMARNSYCELPGEGLRGIVEKHVDERRTVPFTDKDLANNIMKENSV